MLTACYASVTVHCSEHAPATAWLGVTLVQTPWLAAGGVRGHRELCTTAPAEALSQASLCVRACTAELRRGCVGPLLVWRSRVSGAPPCAPPPVLP